MKDKQKPNFELIGKTTIQAFTMQFKILLHGKRLCENKNEFEQHISFQANITDNSKIEKQFSSFVRYSLYSR